MKKILFYIVVVAALCSSCSDFLDVKPYDALSPATTWKTEKDANAFAVGCYSSWLDGGFILYFDCASDIGYNNFPWEGYKLLGNGTFTAANPGVSFYDFTTIRRCNEFLAHIDAIQFADDDSKKDLKAQIRTIRAYEYFTKNFWYGGVPMIQLFQNAEEAKVARESEEAIKQYVYGELDALIPDLKVNESATGRINRGTALAIKMRSALYWGDYQRAKEAASAIMTLNKYEIDPSYNHLFTLAGQSSKEIIYAVKYLKTLQSFWICGAMYNNADGGWSSLVPTQNLVNMYEMKDGLTKEESGDYDPVHPFYHRDPRMAMTILYPGQNWKGNGKPEVVLNTLDKQINGEDNINYPTKAGNSSKTALSWAKYTTPMNQYKDIWDTSTSPIVFRYAEVLLSYAEAANELAAAPTDDIYNAINLVRQRQSVAMPAVDRAKYNTKEKLRELIRRERCVEFAGEGLRRADIVRWKDATGKMLAETVLNGVLERIVGTVNNSEADPTKRATINTKAPIELKTIETRIFSSSNRYLPIPQEALNRNPNLVQNPGY